MGRDRRGNVKYVAINYAMMLATAILSFAAGPLTVTISSAVLYFIGVLAIICGGLIVFNGVMSLGQTSPGATAVAIALGIGATSGGGALMAYSNELLSMGNWPGSVSSALGAIVILFFGFTQLNKRHEPYVNGTKYQRRGKFFAKVTPISLILGGVILLAVNIIIMIGTNSGSEILPRFAISALKYFGALFGLLGMATWSSYMVAVRKALKQSGRSIDSFKGYSTTRRETEHSAPRLADEQRVYSEMESLAQYFTGGFDYPCEGAKITYSVRVYIEDREIKFTLHCSFSGSYPPSAENAVMNTAKTMMQKRQRLVLNKAAERLEKICPDKDYKVTVVLEID